MTGKGSSVKCLEDSTLPELSLKDLGGEALRLSIGVIEAGSRRGALAVDEDEGCRVMRSAGCFNCAITLVPEMVSPAGMATVDLR